MSCIAVRKVQQVSAGGWNLKLAVVVVCIGASSGAVICCGNGGGKSDSQ